MELQRRKVRNGCIIRLLFWLYLHPDLRRPSAANHSLKEAGEVWTMPIGLGVPYVHVVRFLYYNQSNLS